MVSLHRSRESRRGLAKVQAAGQRAPSPHRRGPRVLPLIALGSCLALAVSGPARAQDPVYPPGPAPQGNPAAGGPDLPEPAPPQPAPPQAPAAADGNQYPPAPAQPAQPGQPADGGQAPAAAPDGGQYPPAPAPAAGPDQNPAGSPGEQYPPAAAPANVPPQAYVAPAPGDQDNQYPPAGTAAGPQYANGAPGATAPAAAAAQSGPVRMARISMLDGGVSWRPDDNSPWQTATDNLPLDQGAEIAVADDGHVEIQFDDGSFLRLSPGSSATLVTLYSDAQGEFTEIHSDRGIATLHLTNDHSIYQVDSVNAQVKVAGPATVRVGVGDVTDVAVRAGQAQVEGAAGDVTLNSGNYLAVAPGDTAYNVQALPDEDSWDTWNDQRDADLANAAAAVPEGALPPDIALAAPDLSTYGTWATVPTYGSVWYPRARPGWRPYYNGRWTYFAPYGWTWVSSEPWGWAPYHYGTWVDTANGWAWVPGPANQYWSPAVVHFSTVDDTVAWCPLAPEEVVYPDAFAIGDYGNSWSLFFSVGGCGVYLADEGGICRPHPWNWGYLHAHDWRPDGGDRGGLTPAEIQRHEFGAGIAGGTLVDHPFVPRNQRFGAAVVVGTADFENHGAYRVGGVAATAIFASGHATVLTAGHPVAGPVSVHPVGSNFVGSNFENRGATTGTFLAPQSTHAGGFTTPSDPAAAARAARGSLGFGGGANPGNIPRTGYSTAPPSFYDRYGSTNVPRVQGSLYGSGYGSTTGSNFSHGYGSPSYTYPGTATSHAGGYGSPGYTYPGAGAARTGTIGSPSRGYANSSGGFSHAPVSSGVSNAPVSTSSSSGSSGGSNPGNPNHGH